MGLVSGSGSGEAVLWGWVGLGSRRSKALAYSRWRRKTTNSLFRRGMGRC